MSTGEPSPGLLIATLMLSVAVGAGSGWAVRKVRWWVMPLLAAVVVGGGAAIAGGLTYSTPGNAGPAAVGRLAAAGLVTAGVSLGVIALLVSWFLCHRSVRRAALIAQRRRVGGAAPRIRRRPPVVGAGSGYIPRGAVIQREKS